jgi:hypothetical protein
MKKWGVPETADKIMKEQDMPFLSPKTYNFAPPRNS